MTQENDGDAIDPVTFLMECHHTFVIYKKVLGSRQQCFI